MTISLTNTGKRFNKEWIFRHLNVTFNKLAATAVIGNNGSGKSTLLQILAGALTHNEGDVTFSNDNGQTIAQDKIYKQITIAAPYLELVEELTLSEILHFHQTFKPFQSGISIKNIISEIGLEKAAHQQIRYYSSGMKQRVKLAQAIFSDTPLLLLDEPCTNLDKDGILLYQRLIKEFASNKLIIVSSNDEQEYQFCTESINMLDYK